MPRPPRLARAHALTRLTTSRFALVLTWALAFAAAAPGLARADSRDDGDKPTSERDYADPTEPAHRQQLYLGVRYRGTIVPQFIENLFVDEGRTVYSNSVGLELDVRNGRFSVIPHLVYSEYGMQPTLFRQKGKDAANPANYTVVESHMKAIYLGADFLWSTRLADRLDFEAGLGVGLGFLFGDLVNDWAHVDASSPLSAANGTHYAACKTQGDGAGCAVSDHTGSTTPKVNGYVEPTWFSGGGSVPSMYLRFSAPILGLRIKALRDLELRTQVGFAVTEGFFFQLSGNFRLPAGG